VAGNAVISIAGVRSALDRELALRMAPASRGNPRRGGMAILAGGRKLRMARKGASVVVVLMTTHALRGRSCVNRGIPGVTCTACERLMCTGQRPCMLEGRGRPSVREVTSAARGRKAVVRRAHCLLELGLMTHQTVRLPHRDPIMVLPGVTREAEEPRASQGYGHPRPLLPSLQRSHLQASSIPSGACTRRATVIPHTLRRRCLL
jgi:hypothetical protein